MLRVVLLTCWMLLLGLPVVAEGPRATTVSFLRDDQQQTITGQVQIEAADGGLLLETASGRLWILEGSEVLQRSLAGGPFTPLTHDEMAEQLLTQLPPGFRIRTTPHYVVVYNTSRAYAQWTSGMLERLYKAFTNYWQKEGMELHEPKFPLVVQVFADRASYEQVGKKELGGSLGSIVGYYSMQTNRVSMYDLTGAESLHGSLRGPGHRRGSLKEINQMLSRREAIPLVATVVHEATHQIAFNCGLQTRYADIPLWLCEGMAVYFEAPDLSSSRGWRGIGKVNYSRLETFRHNRSRWNQNSLKNLLAHDRLFRSPRSAADAYADAWALNYFLIKYHPKHYAAYLKAISKKLPLVQEDPATRLAEFTQNFGDIRQLEREFLKKMARVK